MEIKHNEINIDVRLIISVIEILMFWNEIQSERQHGDHFFLCFSFFLCVHFNCHQILRHFVIFVLFCLVSLNTKLRWCNMKMIKRSKLNMFVWFYFEKFQFEKYWVSYNSETRKEFCEFGLVILFMCVSVSPFSFSLHPCIYIYAHNIII